MMCITVSDG